MSEVYSETFYDVARTLFLAFLALQAYNLTRDYGEKAGRFSALRQAAAWIAGIALFAAVTTGSPSCEESDPISGCYQDADDGFEPSMDQRGAKFLFWALLLGVPAAFGLMQSRRYSGDPWRRPEEAKPLD
jgi:hypothetical protein